MTMWIKLSPEETHDFQVPWEVASSQNTQFYSTANLSNLYVEQRWPLLNFTFHKDNPQVVSFQPCRVEFDFINEVEDYNPLEEFIGHKISLNRREYVDLIGLLEEVSHDMSASYKRPLNALKRLTPLQHKQFRVPWNAKINSRQRVFIQADKPSPQNGYQPLITLILLTASNETPFHNHFNQVPATKYQIQICEFSEHDLLNEFFDPLQHATNSIDFNSRGLREFAKVLREFMNEENQHDNLSAPLFFNKTRQRQVQYA
ncbi:MAG: hypothetical protein AAF490_18010 [Chloroflexota bacterium]